MVLPKKKPQILLKEEQLDGDELEALIEAKNLGMVHFTLVDTREYMEFQMGHIVGTDVLSPYFTILRKSRRRTRREKSRKHHRLLSLRKQKLSGTTCHERVWVLKMYVTYDQVSLDFLEKHKEGKFTLLRGALTSAYPECLLS